MNRRDFLKYLGLAPAAVIIAYNGAGEEVIIDKLEPLVHSHVEYGKGVLVSAEFPKLLAESVMKHHKQMQADLLRKVFK